MNYTGIYKDDNGITSQMIVIDRGSNSDVYYIYDKAGDYSEGFRERYVDINTGFNVETALGPPYDTILKSDDVSYFEKLSNKHKHKLLQLILD